MGYEVKLLVGQACGREKKAKRSSHPEIDGDSIYYPYLKDLDGNFVYDGSYETYFMVTAHIDLCKPGYESSILAALRKNEDPNHEYYYYGSDGSTRISEDCYGDKSDIHSLGEIIEALKKDVLNDDYRRFKWALSLLESIRDNEGDDMKVMWYGH